MKKKHFIEVIAAIAIVFVLGGCSMLQSAINDIKGSLVGNDYTIFTYDNYGSKVLKPADAKSALPVIPSRRLIMTATETSKNAMSFLR